MYASKFVYNLERTFENHFEMVELSLICSLIQSVLLFLPGRKTNCGNMSQCNSTFTFSGKFC